MHLQEAINYFEKIINNQSEHKLRGIYPYNMVTIAHYNKIYQDCDSAMVKALDQIFYLHKLDYLELDEETKIDYQERQFCLRFKTPKLQDNQERLDRLYDELCGNNGLDPHVKNIQGDPHVLIALAKEFRYLRLQLKIAQEQESECSKTDFFKHHGQQKEEQTSSRSSMMFLEN